MSGDAISPYANRQQGGNALLLLQLVRVARTYSVRGGLNQHASSEKTATLPLDAL